MLNGDIRAPVTMNASFTDGEHTATRPPFKIKKQQQQ